MFGIFLLISLRKEDPIEMQNRTGNRAMGYTGKKITHAVILFQALYGQDNSNSQDMTLRNIGFICVLFLLFIVSRD